MARRRTKKEVVGDVVGGFANLFLPSWQKERQWKLQEPYLKARANLQQMQADLLGSQIAIYPEYLKKVRALGGDPFSSEIGAVSGDAVPQEMLVTPPSPVSRVQTSPIVDALREGEGFSARHRAGDLQPSGLPGGRPQTSLPIHPWEGIEAEEVKAAERRDGGIFRPMTPSTPLTPPSPTGVLATQGTSLETPEQSQVAMIQLGTEAQDFPTLPPQWLNSYGVPDPGIQRRRQEVLEMSGLVSPNMRIPLEPLVENPAYTQAVHERQQLASQLITQTLNPPMEVLDITSPSGQQLQVRVRRSDLLNPGTIDRIKSGAPAWSPQLASLFAQGDPRLVNIPKPEDQEPPSMEGAPDEYLAMREMNAWASGMATNHYTGVQTIQVLPGSRENPNGVWGTATRKMSTNDHKLLTEMAGIYKELADIQRMSLVVNTASPEKALITGLGKRITAAMELNPQARAYLDTVEAFAAQFARLGGEGTGRLSDPDIVRALKMVPTLYDSAIVAKDKLTRMDAFLRVRRKTLEWGGLGPSVDQYVRQEDYRPDVPILFAPLYEVTTEDIKGYRDAHLASVAEEASRGPVQTKGGGTPVS